MESTIGAASHRSTSRELYAYEEADHIEDLQLVVKGLVFFDGKSSQDVLLNRGDGLFDSDCFENGQNISNDGFMSVMG